MGDNFGSKFSGGYDNNMYNGSYQNNFGGQKPPVKFSAKAIVGFVLSLVAFFVLPLPCGIVGLVFSALAMRDAGNGLVRGKGMAIAGLVISIINVVYGTVALIIGLAGISVMF